MPVSNQSADADESSRTALSRRRLTQLAGGGAIAGLAGCLTSGDEVADGTLRISGVSAPDSIDPAQGSGALDRLGVYENLLGVDREMRVQSELATDWGVDDDNLVWTFELREDVNFHDGSSFDADAAEFALDRAFDSADRLQAMPVESVEATDTHELEITTTEPSAPLPAYLTLLDAAIIAPSSLDGGEFEQPVCTGPFALSDWEPEVSYTVERNDDYYGTVPDLKRVIHEEVTDNQTKVLRLENADLDISVQLPASSVDQLQNNPDVEITIYDVSALRFLAFNVDQPPFDDRAVRQAIAHAVDVEDLIDSVLEGIGEPAIGPLSPSLTHWANEDLEPYTYDIDRADDLLTQAGWVREDDDSIRRRDGEAFSITLWTYQMRPELSLIAEILQSQLQEIGIDVSLRVTEWGAMDEAKQAGEFDVCLETWNAFWWPDPDRMMSFYHSEDTPIYTGYDDETANELIERGRRAPDPDDRKAIYDELQAHLHEDLPLAFLTYNQYVTGYRTAVEGFEPNRDYSYNLENVSLNR
ncbi:ABC transporter substrate-binding protein [Natrialbaceae archaeon A-arb3/5]